MKKHCNQAAKTENRIKYIVVAILIVMSMVSLVLVGCSKKGNEPEILSGVCINGVKWQYSDGIFTLTELKTLKNNQSVIYSLSIYNNGGPVQQISVTDTKFSSVKIPCDVEGLNEYTLEISFLNNMSEPLCNTSVFDIVNKQQTCTSSGYQSVYNYFTDTKIIINASPALDHDYGEEKNVIEPGTIVECGYKERICTRCGDTKKEVFYADTNIARLYMYGDLTGISKRSEVYLTATFDGQDESFNCYVSLKQQGHSSLMYEKNNFTLKLFKDEDRNQKYKIELENWKAEHKYILKANYIDPSACRNLVCADIWSEMVDSRDGNKLIVESSPTNGVTDGFPIALYLNDEFFGLYTMTLHRDDDLFGMNDGVMDAIAVTNTSHTDESRFKINASFADNSDWEVEFNGLDDNAWVIKKVNELIDFVTESSDEVFKKNLSVHLDVNSAIDYLIAVYALGIPDNASKNLTMITYSNGPWTMSLCDMECAFGLMPYGTGFYSPDWCLPTQSEGKWDSSTDSLLWDRLLTNFENEIKARYSELRKSVITPEKIINKVESFTSSIPKEFYVADMELYPQMPFADVSATEQVKEYVTERLALLDNIFMYE